MKNNDSKASILLKEYLKIEVDFRLENVHENIDKEKITETLIDECVEELMNNCNVIFDYEVIDGLIGEILNKRLK